MKAQGTSLFTATLDVDDLEPFQDGMKILFNANKEWYYTMDSEVTLQLEDGSTVAMEISNSDTMDIMGKK